MKKVALVPDSFKGTMSAALVCDIMAKAVTDNFPHCQALSIPVADGGEGTVEAFVKACQGEIVHCRVYDPYFNETDSFLGLIDNGKTAVIEMAAAAGIGFRREFHNIEDTTTYGVGQLIEQALDLGAEKIIVGLGGSLTNDAACGLCAALGGKFYDSSGQAFIPVSGTLGQIHRIDLSSLDKRLSKVKLIAMCDITNPLYGENGAAYVFSPQKGATPSQVEKLDQGLRHLAQVAKDLPNSQPFFAGAGAAGGMGYGLRSFLNAQIQQGIDTVLDAVDFENKVRDCDLIFTGEGKIDSQSLQGKAIIGIAKRCKALGKFLIAVVGAIGEDLTGEVYERGVGAVFCSNRASLPFEKAKLRCEKDLYDTMNEILKVIKTVKR